MKAHFDKGQRSAVVRTGRVVLVAALALIGPRGSVRAAEVDLVRDPVLAALRQDALAKRPELARARAALEAERARVPQVSALPDPVLALGIQNDGFDALRIGEMETSWWSVVATQAIPLRGQRGLRGSAQSLEALQAEADLERARLSAVAEVERAYVDLLLVRDRLLLQARLESLWIQAEGAARARYEAGDGDQADVLRSQLERSRLRQQRAALEAEARTRSAELNLSAGRNLDEPIPRSLSLDDVLDPPFPDSAQAQADAVARSPELRRAELAVERSRTLVALAGREAFPDLTVIAGIMPRGGEFPTMWQAGVAFTVPLWSGSRRSGLESETRLRSSAAERELEAVGRLLRQRVLERQSTLAALLEANRIYRSGLLVQSEATVSSVMTQYRVGRMPFAGVLEAVAGHVADLAGFHESVAATQRIEIARREVSLDSVAGAAAGGVGTMPVPGSGAMNRGPTPATQPASTAPAAATAPAMSRM